MINPSVCLSVCLSVHKRISEAAGPIFTIFHVQIPCGRGSVFLWWRCDTLCTSGFVDDVTFGRNGRDAQTCRMHTKHYVLSICPKNRSLLSAAVWESGWSRMMAVTLAELCYKYNNLLLDALRMSDRLLYCLQSADPTPSFHGVGPLEVLTFCIELLHGLLVDAVDCSLVMII